MKPFTVEKLKRWNRQGSEGRGSWIQFLRRRIRFSLCHRWFAFASVLCSIQRRYGPIYYQGSGRSPLVKAANSIRKIIPQAKEARIVRKWYLLPLSLHEVAGKKRE